MRGDRTKSGRLRAGVRALQRPWITALALVVLLVGVFHARYSSHTPRALLAAKPGAPTRTLMLEYYVVRDAPTAGAAPVSPPAPRFRVIDPDRDSADELVRAAQSTPRLVYRALFTRTLGSTGVFAPTALRETQTLLVEPLGAPQARDDFALAWHAARDALPDVLGPRTFTVLPALAAAAAPELRGAVAAPRADASSSSTRTLWTGHAVNALTLGALVVLVLSLGWVPRVPAAVRTARRQLALDEGRCPRCGYYIRTLPEMTCPECGWGREIQSAKGLKG